MIIEIPNENSILKWKNDGKDAARKLLRHFIAEQHIEDPDRPHDRGYNSALKDLSEFIEETL